MLRMMVTMTMMAVMTTTTTLAGSFLRLLQPPLRYDRQYRYDKYKAFVLIDVPKMGLLLCAHR
jgi:hypothetical protein